MIVEVLGPIHLRKATGDIHLRPGVPVELLDEEAIRLLQKAPNKVRVVSKNVQSPQSPLQRGWLVAYRDQSGRLCGGCDERDRGTVSRCEWDGTSWAVTVGTGEVIPIGRVVSVGKTAPDGRVVAAWRVKEHGHDGEGRQSQAEGRAAT